MGTTPRRRIAVLNQQHELGSRQDAKGFAYERMKTDKLRKRGFAAVWERAGSLLGKDNGRLDRYLRNSHTYSTVATLLLRLRAMDESMSMAKTILDVTAMTGFVSKRILETMPESVVYANEISAGMKKKRDATLGAYEATGRCIPVSIDISEEGIADNSIRMDTTGEYKVLGPLKGQFDLMLWWGSFQIVAGRKMSINNAFDLLREGGHLVLLDIYPVSRTDLAHALGEETAGMLAQISKPLDMQEGVKEIVTNEWTLKALQERQARGLTDARSIRVDIREFGKRMDDEGAFREMRCLCFTRPRTGSTERTAFQPEIEHPVCAD